MNVSKYLLSVYLKDSVESAPALNRVIFDTYEEAQEYEKEVLLDHEVFAVIEELIYANPKIGAEVSIDLHEQIKTREQRKSLENFKPITFRLIRPKSRKFAWEAGLMGVATLNGPPRPAPKWTQAQQESYIEDCKEYIKELRSSKAYEIVQHRNKIRYLNSELSEYYAEVEDE